MSTDVDETGDLEEAEVTLSTRGAKTLHHGTGGVSIGAEYPDGEVRRVRLVPEEYGRTFTGRAIMFWRRVCWNILRGDDS